MITGSWLSSTVITVVQVAVWPFPSLTVQITEVTPLGSITPAKVAVLFKLLVIVPSAQLSVNVASNSVPTTVYWHTSKSVLRVALGMQVITGSWLSSTVITVVQVAVWPFPSSTVQITVVSPFGSTSPAKVAVLLKLFVIVPLGQLSVKVASNSVPTIVYWQVSKSVLRVALGTQVITGAILSSIVTVVVQLEELPLASVTVKVTVFSPMLLQSNVLGLTVLVAIPQLSVEPPSISAGVMLTIPLASNWSIIGEPNIGAVSVFSKSCSVGLPGREAPLSW